MKRFLHCEPVFTSLENAMQRKTRPKRRPGFRSGRSYRADRSDQSADFHAADSASRNHPRSAHGPSGRRAPLPHTPERGNIAGRAAGGNRAAEMRAADQPAGDACGDLAMLQPWRLASPAPANRQSLRPRQRQQMSSSCLGLSWRWRLAAGAGFKVTHTRYSNWRSRKRSAQQSIESKRCRLMA